MDKNVFCEAVTEAEKIILKLDPFPANFLSPSHLVIATSQCSCNTHRKALTALSCVHELTDTQHFFYHYFE